MSRKKRHRTRTRAPDPATSYERARPEKEAGMGRLDCDVATPTRRPDMTEQTVRNRSTNRQLNAHDVVDERTTLKQGRK
ncbi:MAG TPA: hypothetical protein VH518_20465 [Tepidisphaeraceae bacterium]|jgi:hypothetical protein